MLYDKALQSSHVCSLNIRELSEFAVDGVARMINAGSCSFLECIVFNCALLALRQLRETIILRPTAMTSDFT